MTKLAGLLVTATALSMVTGCAQGGDHLGSAQEAVISIQPIADGVLSYAKAKIDLKQTLWVHTDQVTLEPGDVVPYHTHPGQGVVTVIAGSPTFKNADGSVEHHSAGETFFEESGNYHSPINCGSTTVKMVGNFFVPCAEIGCTDLIIFDFSRPPATCP